MISKQKLLEQIEELDEKGIHVLVRRFELNTYPWIVDILRKDGPQWRRHYFRGAPNYFETRAEAMQKGIAVGRAMLDGSYEKMYAV